MREDFKEGEYLGFFHSPCGGFSHPVFNNNDIKKWFKKVGIDYKFHIVSCRTNTLYFAFKDFDNPIQIRVSDHGKDPNDLIIIDMVNINIDTICGIICKKFKNILR